MSCPNTHVLRISRPSGDRQWHNLATGLVETDLLKIADLEAQLLNADCECGAVECRESQEWTYGLDNTGTSFSDTASYVIELSDGTILEFDQTSTGGWSQQLTLWAANIQTAADNAGLNWFVEPRAVNNPNPTDISGNYGNSPTGLTGAPSIPVAQALISGGMVARYVNIQICPGQPTPVDAYRTDSAIYTNNPFSLTTAGPVLGPLQKFSVCTACGEEPIWYLEDGVTKADAGQVPNCWEPCGTLTLADSPPETDCDFQITVACDDNGQANTANFTNTITRRAKICNGEQINVDFFEQDPNDPSALIPYTLVGDFVDCATGEPIALPEVPCEDFVVTDLFSLEIPNGGLRNREWHDTAPVVPIAASTTQVGRDFYDNHDESLPTTTDTIVSTLVLNDTDNTASELDIQYLEGSLVVEEGLWIQYAGASEGYQAIYVGECGGPLERLADGGGSGITVGPVYLPKGTHQVRLVNIDSGGTNSSKNLQVSTDGITFVTDNTPEGVLLSQSTPVETCHKVKVCKDSGLMFDLLTGEELDPEALYPCSKLCTACCGGGGEGEGGGATAQEIADAIAATPETDLPLTLVQGTGSVPAGLKSVTINNITGVTTINGGFALGAGRRVDSISFGTERGNNINEILPAYTLAGGTWQWIGHQ